MLRELSTVWRQVACLDPSVSGINEPRKNYPKGKIYVLGVYDSPAKVEEVDFKLAISTEAVEHLFYPRELVRFAHAMLTKGGVFMVSTPYHGWLKSDFISLFGLWGSHHTPIWDGGHIKFWFRPALRKLVEEKGIEVIRFHACGHALYLFVSMIVVGRKK